MSEELSVEQMGREHMQVLTFDMRGETFAIEAGMVREILDHIPETQVPGSMRMVGSVVNFRGRVIPLADLHTAFGFEPGEDTVDSRVVVIEFMCDNESTYVGLKADKVHEVTIIEQSSTETAPRVGMRWRQDYIRCLAKRDGDLIVIPDLERIFTDGCKSHKADEPASVLQH